MAFRSLSALSVIGLVSGDCGWIHTCGARGCADCKDDGSQGYKECCGSGPSPPSPPSPSGPRKLYCPSADDFVIGDGASWTGSGWKIHGSGGVQGKTSFNMLGGFVEFDYDSSGAKWGVNNNFYTISPDHPYTSYNDYCDGQGPEASSPTGTYCMELDIWEGNGNQNGATTWHTWFNRNGGCDMSGCAAMHSGGGKMHFRVDFDDSGDWHVKINGQENGGFNPSPSSNAKGSVRDTMERVGVTFVSSQWTGWVPGAGSVHGDLGNSEFSVSNLRVSGKVLMGPTPPECSGPHPSPSPGPSPTPPSPSGAGQCCFGGCGQSCQGGWCGQSESHCTGNCKGTWCPTASESDVVV